MVMFIKTRMFCQVRFAQTCVAVCFGLSFSSVACVVLELVGGPNNQTLSKIEK